MLDLLLLLRLLAAITVFLSYTVTSVSAIKCYQCMSSIDTGCNDPINETYANATFLLECHEGIRNCIKTYNSGSGYYYSTFRWCGNHKDRDRCRETSSGRYDETDQQDNTNWIMECTCNTDACNSATSLKCAASSILLSVLLGICVLLYF